MSFPVVDTLVFLGVKEFQSAQIAGIPITDDISEQLATERDLMRVSLPYHHTYLPVVLSDDSSRSVL